MNPFTDDNGKRPTKKSPVDRKFSLSLIECTALLQAIKRQLKKVRGLVRNGEGDKLVKYKCVRDGKVVPMKHDNQRG